MPLTVGQILQGRYRIEQILGQGGFGAVYKATDLRLNRACAVKENLDTTPDAREQFVYEAQFLVRLGKHPNLVQVFDFFVEPNDVQYLVMEMVEGEDLDTLVQRQGPLVEAQAIEWMGQVLDAVEYLHTQNPPIIHRDIKPMNIRITPQGRAMLVDFGIAKEYTPRQRTGKGARAGTPGFAPPEQFGGAGTDQRSDIYALGATLYFLLTRQVPLDAFELLTSGKLIELRRYNPAVSHQTERIVQKAMALRPEERYRSAQEMRHTLLAAISPVTAPSIPRVGLVCNTCGKPARLGARYCSHCGTPLQPPPPPFVFAPRPPIFGSITIPLVCTLEHAKSEIFVRTRYPKIQTIVNSILYAQPITKAQTFMLRGIKGFGGTTIAESIRDKIREGRGANLVALVILPEKAPVEGWAPIIEEMLRGLKQGAGTVNEKLQKTVEQYHRCISDRRYFHVERGEQAEVEITLPQAKILGNELDLGAIKKKPIPSTPPPPPVDEKQRGQILFHALRDLIDYLVSQNARVVLIIDKVFDLETLQPLRPLTVSSNVFIVTVAEKAQYDLWRFNTDQSELLSQFSKVDQFFPCIWEMPRDLCYRLTQGRPEADTHAFTRFIKYLQFKGRGLPDLVIRAIAPYYTDPRELKAKGVLQRLFHRTQEGTPLLHVPAEELPMIFAIADLEDFLSSHWSDLFRNLDNSRIMGNEVVSAAKVAIYTLSDWLFQQGQSGVKCNQSNIIAYAQAHCGIPDTQKWIVENLIQLLRQDGVCSMDADGCLSFSTFYDRRND